MKRVSSSRRLQLNKETLRTLTPDELQSAAGATGFYCALTRIETLACPPLVLTLPGTKSLPSCVPTGAGGGWWG